MDWEAQGGNRVIPVKNIYYMLGYAFSALRSRGFADLATEDFENADDLLAAILTRGLSQQVKRGLKREYLEQEQILSSPRGKIDVSASIKARFDGSPPARLQRRRILREHAVQQDLEDGRAKASHIRGQR